MSSIAALPVETGTVRVFFLVSSGALNEAGFTDTASVIESDIWFGYATSTTGLRDGSFADRMRNHGILLHRMVW